MLTVRLVHRTGTTWSSNPLSKPSPGESPTTRRFNFAHHPRITHRSDRSVGYTWAISRVRSVGCRRSSGLGLPRGFEDFEDQDVWRFRRNVSGPVAILAQIIKLSHLARARTSMASRPRFQGEPKQLADILIPHIKVQPICKSSAADHPYVGLTTSRNRLHRGHG